MFEQGLAYLLKKLLGEYVEDGNILQERIQVGVWSGLIVLENLVLKNSVFDLIDVPISLNYGYIGRLELRIPWGNLGVDPVTIIIDKINILKSLVTRYTISILKIY
jgi:vacuolar protein sorting-associated protein 13A/C